MIIGKIRVRHIPTYGGPLRSGFLLAAMLLATTVLIGVFPGSARAASGTSAIQEPGNSGAAGAIKRVVIVGVAGLRWSDIDKAATPTLWKLADRGGIASLSVRAAARITCPDDGWTTLGAGNRARGLVIPVKSGSPKSGCTSDVGIKKPVVAPDGSSRLPEQLALLDANDKLNYGAEPGMLAASIGCVAAVGEGAVLAAAHPDGYVDYYATALPPDPAAVFRRCPVTVVSAGEVDDTDRVADLRRVDALLTTVTRFLPASSALITVGVADTTPPIHLRPLIVNGAGFGATWLTSASTRKDHYTQLIDIAPTVFELLGVGKPTSVLGQPVTVVGSRDTSTASAIDSLVDDDVAAVTPRPWVQPFFILLIVLNIALMAAAGVFFNRRRRAVAEAAATPVRAAEVSTEDEPELPIPPTRFGWERVVEVAAVALASLPVASFLAQLVPWWRAPLPLVVHAGCIVAMVAVITVVAHLGPWVRWPLGPSAVVAVVTAVTLGIDVITGSVMQLNSLAGYSPIVAGRFVGFGNLASPMFASATLLSAAYIAQLFPARRRGLFLITVSFVAVAIVGAPIWGSDAGGVIALAPAGIVLALSGAGIRLSVLKVVGCLGVGLAAVAVFGAIDYARPERDRTHLGRFVQQLLDGTAGTVLQRKAESNLHLLFTSKLTLLVIAVVLFVTLLAWRRGAGLRRVLGIYPCVRAGLLAVIFAAGFGFVANDSGVAVPAFAAVVTVPLVIATTLRVLRP